MIGSTDVFTLSSSSTSSVNAEGRTVKAVVSQDVEGRVDELTTRDVEVAAQVGQTHDIVAQAPLETVVNDTMTLTVKPPSRLAGTYKIDTIRTTRRRLRILASRTTIKD